MHFQYSEKNKIDFGMLHGWFVELWTKFICQHNQLQVNYYFLQIFYRFLKSVINLLQICYRSVDKCKFLITVLDACQAKKKYKYLKSALAERKQFQNLLKFMNLHLTVFTICNSNLVTDQCKHLLHWNISFPKNYHLFDEVINLRHFPTSTVTQ